MGYRALPYQTAARWVEVFKHGHAATVDLLGSEHPESAHTEVQVPVIEHFLTDERHWTVAELSTHSGISAVRVFCILRKDFASKWTIK